MPAPTNISPATATDVGVFPFTLSQQADFGGTTYDLWFKGTFAVPQTVSVWVFGDLVTYLPAPNIYESDGVTRVLNNGLASGANKIVQFPVAAGTYYFKAKTNAGNPSPANLTISGFVAPTLPILPGYVLTNDDLELMPGCVMDPATGLVTSFILDMANGEGGAILPNGEFILTRDDEGSAVPANNDKLNIYNADGTLKVAFDFTTGGNGTYLVGASNTHFYAYSSFSPFKTLARFDTMGTSLATWVFGATAILAIAPARDDAVLYYALDPFTSNTIKRWDLVNNVGLSDLYTFAVNTQLVTSTGIGVGALLVLADGSVVIGVHDTALATYKVLRLASDGSVLNTIDLTASGQLNHIALNTCDTSTSFWAWSRRGVSNATSRYQEIRISDGMVLQTFDIVQYESGQYFAQATLTPANDFGPSFSCPFLVLRATPIPPECPNRPIVTAAQGPTPAIPLILTPPVVATIITTSDDPAAVTYAASTSGGTGSVVLTYDPPSGSLFALGDTIVTVTASDASTPVQTQTASFTVRRVKTLKLTCPARETVASPDGNPVAVTYSPATTTGGRQPITITYSQASGTLFPVGTTTVIVTATDSQSHPQTKTCSFTVTVTAPPPPGSPLLLTCPLSQTVASSDGSPVAVTYAATTTGGVLPVSLVYSPVSGSSFPVGTTSVLVTATDSTGGTPQVQTCTFTVTVTPPPLVLTCPVVPTVSSPSGTPVAVSYVATTTGGTGTVTLVYNPPSGSHFPVGSTVVSVTATDSGTPAQVETCLFTVTVTVPVQPPPPPPPPPVLQLVQISGPNTATTGQTIGLVATGSYSDGSSKDVTTLATWSSSNLAVATISSPGKVLAVAGGSVQITAVLGAVVSSGFTITVSVPTPAPDVPSSPSPVTLATGVSQTPLLHWVSANATSYDVYFGTFAAPVLVSSGQVSSSYAPGTLLVGQQYFWQIVARNVAGTTTGPVWSFTTLAAPTVSSVAITGPTTGTVGQVLGYTAVATYSDASTRDVTSTASWASSNGTTASISAGQATALAVGTTNISASFGGHTSSSITLTVSAPPPAIPDTPNTPVPATLAVNVPYTQTLQWTSARATSYDVKFGTSSPPGLAQAGITVSSYSPGTLAVGQQYFWQIIARNVSGSVTGPIWSFTTLPAPTVSSVAINGPTAGTVGQQLGYSAVATYSDGSTQIVTPTAAWNSSVPADATIAAGTATCLAAGTTNITAVFGGQTSNTKALVVSPVPGVPPATPNTPAPNDASTGVVLAPTLQWSAAGATSYAVAFGTVTPPPARVSGITASSLAVGTLLASTRYYWRVVATNSFGSTTGPIWSFTTTAPPPPPPPPPTLTVTCPPNRTAVSATGADVAVTYPPATTGGGTGAVTVVYSKASGALFAVGNTVVTCTATDSGSPQQQAICSFIVTVTRGSDPTSNQLLAQTDIVYLGAFRLPIDVGFDYGGQGMAFNPAGPSLFIGGFGAQTVGEVTIPAAVNSSSLGALNFATTIQACVDPTGGKKLQVLKVATDDVRIGGYAVVGGRLIYNAYSYYDGSASNQIRSHARRSSLSLTSGTAGDFQPVWGNDAFHLGMLSGYMCPVPTEWQTLLGGPLISGQTGGNGNYISIISRTSAGPSAFVFDPANLVGGSTILPATPLLMYPTANGALGEHATLGPWIGQNLNFGMGTSMAGVAIPSGFRTLLYVGRNGASNFFCYGSTNPADMDVQASNPPGLTVCTDPTSESTGTHAYPYRYQFWAYDMNDIVAVKNGLKQAWDPIPYATWTITLPIGTANAPAGLGGDGNPLGGAAYDPTTKRLYVAQQFTDPYSSANMPLVHVFQIG